MNLCRKPPSKRGRPSLSGDGPGKRVQIRLSPEHITWLRIVGDGSLSAGVRQAIAWACKPRRKARARG